jgi:hypothetical protein
MLPIAHALAIYTSSHDSTKMDARLRYFLQLMNIAF